MQSYQTAYFYANGQPVQADSMTGTYSSNGTYHKSQVPAGYQHASTSAMTLETPFYPHRESMYQASSPGSSAAISPTSTYSHSTGQTPITPLSLASPISFKDGQSSASMQPQDSWFASMQDSYLANQQAIVNRPALQGMQRMSISAPESSRQQANGQYLSLPGTDDQPPRRASVVTFQPTAQRPSVQPRRPSFQSSPGSDPLMGSPTYRRQQYKPQLSLAPIPQQSNSLEVPQVDVDRLFSEVFGPTTANTPTLSISPSSNSYGPVHMQSAGSHHSSYPPSVPAPAVYSPSTTPIPPVQVVENYNFGGVLLQPEDFHMLGPDPLATDAQSTFVPSSTYTGASPASSGWQSNFALGSSSLAPAPSSQSFLAVPTSPVAPNWNFSSFHGFTPLASPGGTQHCDTIPERPASAPPINDPEVLPVDSSDVTSMDRRRGSSIDSPALLPFGGTDAYTSSSVYQPAPGYPQPELKLSPRSPVYLGGSPTRAGPNASALAARRATVGPGHLSIPARPLSATRLPGQKPPPSAPVRLLSPSSPTRKTARGGRRASAAPMFINFTSKDANKLLSGVAPSGSSKRKREEEEQAKILKPRTDEV